MFFNLKKEKMLKILLVFLILNCTNFHSEKVYNLNITVLNEQGKVEIANKETTYEDFKFILSREFESAYLQFDLTKMLIVFKAERKTKYTDYVKCYTSILYEIENLKTRITKDNLDDLEIEKIGLLEDFRKLPEVIIRGY